MTVLVTRDVAPRFRGFLASCMLEIAPGVYTAPNMSKAVRERVWAVMCAWFTDLHGGSLVITWRDKSAPGGQRIEVLGHPPKVIHDADGLYLVRLNKISSEEVEDEAL